MSERAAPTFSFDAPEAGDLGLVALSLRGREAVSGLYRFDLVLRAEEADPALVESALLGRAATVTLHGDEGDARTVGGVVTRASLRGPAGDGLRARIRVRVEPALALLRHAHRSRIFQDLSVRQVVDLVLADHPAVRAGWRLTARYGPRAYCVQYQETDLAFVLRLLAEEGVRFHFDRGTDGAEELVLTDAPAFARPIDGRATLVYRESESAPDADSVTRFALSRRVAPGRATLREYDWNHPQRPLAAEADAPGPAGTPLEFYEHHGEHDEARVGRDVAALRLQQHRRRASEGSGRSACPRVMPGRAFTLEAPTQPAVEGDYVVVSVEHRAVEASGVEGLRGARYENRFVAVPRAVAVRPARPARRLQQVLETATVTGPSDEEVWVDEHGRIRVRFHWDREGADGDDRRSCWIRAMQPWAGAGYGAQFIPRVGTEVVVSFLGGDVDRPVVLGGLYNGTHPPPFALPERRTRSGLRTRSSPGGEGANELSFEDAAGMEEVLLHAARDLRETVRGDQSVQVDGGRTVTVGGDVQESVGGSRVDSVRGERVATVMGGETLLVLGDRRVDVDGALDRGVRGDAASRVGGALSVQVAGGVDVSVATAEGADAAVAVGGSWRVAVEDDVVIQARRSLTFLCGDSRVEIDREGVRVRAKRVEVAGAEEVLVRTDDAALRLDDDAELTADAVKLYGPGSKLELTGEATLRGGRVHVGRGTGKPVRFVNEDAQQAVFRFVQNRARDPLAHAAVRIRHPDGSEREHVTDADGYVRIPGASQALFEVMGVAGDGARDLVRQRARRS